MIPKFKNEQEELDWLSERNRMVQQVAMRWQLAIFGAFGALLLIGSPVFIGHAITAWRLIAGGVIQ